MGSQKNKRKHINSTYVSGVDCLRTHLYAPWNQYPLCKPSPSFSISIKYLDT